MSQEAVSIHTFSSTPRVSNAAVRAPTCLETRSRVFLTRKRVRQRHRVLIEFGLARQAGCSLGNPLRTCLWTFSPASVAFKK